MDDLEVMEPPRTDPNVLTPDSLEPTPAFMKDEPVAMAYLKVQEYHTEPVAPNIQTQVDEQPADCEQSSSDLQLEINSKP